MSASLFRSKQHTSKKNLKKLTISAPLLSPSTVSPTSYISSPQTPSTPANYGNHHHAFPVIVLVAKYKFVAENPQELSIEPKNYMKLIERPGNGWLKVQILDKYDKIGLIPASYVDIQVNDVLNPISLKWLNEYRDSITDLDTQQEQKDAQRKQDIEDLFDFENVPTSIVFDQVLQNSSRRYWYKIRISFSNKDIIYIGKTYEDFYNLHILMNRAHPQVDLPKLPMPLRLSSSPTHSNTSIDRKFYNDLQERKKNLEVYMNEVLMINTLQKSNEVFNFIDVSRKVKLSQDDFNKENVEVSGDKIRGKSVCELSDSFLDGLPLEKHQDLANQLFPDSVEISKLLNSSRYFSPTAPLPPMIKSTSSVNLLNRKNDSNVKYSTYINQGDQADVKKLVNSNSSNTLMSYTSIIDVYDDDNETEEDSSKDDSFTQSHSIDTKASSLADSKEDITKTILPEKHESVSTVASTVISSVMTPTAANKMNHYSTNSSNSEHDSIFSKHNSNNEAPSTPIAPSVTFTHSEDYAIHTPTTPTTPIIEDAEFENNVSPTNCGGTSPKSRSGSNHKLTEVKTPNGTHDYIKIKISLNNKEDDIVALRIKRTNLISIAYLKKLLSFKIYKDYNLTNHYKLHVVEKANEEEKDMSDEELLEYIKANTKVNLRLARARV